MRSSLWRGCAQPRLNARTSRRGDWQDRLPLESSPELRCVGSEIQCDAERMDKNIFPSFSAQIVSNRTDTHEYSLQIAHPTFSNQLTPRKLPRNQRCCCRNHRACTRPGGLCAPPVHDFHHSNRIESRAIESSLWSQIEGPRESGLCSYSYLRSQMP